MEMIKTARFWLAMFFVFVALSLIGRSAEAQSTTGGIISYDALARSGKPATTPVAAPAPTPAAVRASRPLARVRVDTVRLRWTDTVRVVKTDTVFLSLIDTVPAPVSAAAQPASPSPAAKPAAPAFAPTTVGGLLQVQLTGGDSLLRATYRIRRAELKAVTDLGRRAQAVVMIDAAKALSLNTSGSAPAVSQSSRVLQDAYIVLPVSRWTLDAGQQRLPLGFEGGQGSSGLETIDRALFQSDRARGGALGDVRDLGVAVRGAVGRVDYRLGAFNGTGESMNETDRNVGKALVGQLVLRPAIVRGLRLGVSGASSGAATADKPTRDRFGADVVLTRSRGSLQVEGMAGQDGALQRRGFYALGTVTPITGIKLVSRFDTFDPDIRREGTPADVTQRDWLGGVTWLPAASRLRLHVAVVHRTWTNGITPSNTQLLSQLQAAW